MRPARTADDPLRTARGRPATATARSYCRAASRARAPISRVIAGSSYSVAIASASAAGSPGAATRPQPLSRAICAGSLLGSVAAMYGPSGGEDAVDLARHDEAFEPGLQRHQERVGGGERLVQQRLRLIRKEADVGQPARRGHRLERVRASRRRRRSRSSAAPSTQPIGGVDRARRGSATAPTLPECITTNWSARPCSRANALSFGAGDDRVAVGPVVDDVHARRVGALLLDQPALHRDRRARRCASACASRYRLMRSSARLTGALWKSSSSARLPERCPRSRNTKRAPVRRAGRERRQADDRRIGQRDDDVRPAGTRSWPTVADAK